MMVKTQDDIDHLKVIGGICRDILKAMGEKVKAGVTPRELDVFAGQMLADKGARSAPKLAYNFPGFTCISVGTAVAHGIPDDRPLCEGEFINIDVSAEKNGYFGDCGQSFGVGIISKRQRKLLKTVKKAQFEAMMSIRDGVPINQVGAIVERIAHKEGFLVVEGLEGHGVGRFIHEEPQIPSCYYKHNKAVFKEGMVVAVEPFLAFENQHYYEDDDGWTLRLPDGDYGVQHEHSFIVTKKDPIILTL